MDDPPLNPPEWDMAEELEDTKREIAQLRKDLAEARGVACVLHKSLGINTKGGNGIYMMNRDTIASWKQSVEERKEDK